MKRLGIFFFSLVFPFALVGQTEFKKLGEFKTTPVKGIVFDRLGDIYLNLKSDTIKKYDTEGKFMSALIDPSKAATTLFEPWNPLRVFRYVKSNQQVEIYDRFLEFQEKITVDPAWAIEPMLVAPGSGNNFWVLDKADWSIVLVDPKTKGVVRGTTLILPKGATPDFIWLREYQDLLFLIDRNSGLFIYNTVGKLVYKIDVKDLEYIGFLGEEFYYLADHKLKFSDLYTNEKFEIPVNPSAKFVMVTDERMIVVKETSVEVREFKR